MAYQFDHEWHKERARLAALEAAFDPWSIRALRATSPQPGWRCLEVGGGGGSIAEWLCHQVGAEGEVVATDLETKFLEAVDADNLTVLAHDIVSDPIDQAAFDLIHIRAVLAHLPEREDVARRLAAALRPGGWLVPVVADFASVRAVGLPQDQAHFFDHGFASVIQAAQAIGFDPFYGRGIGDVLRRLGLAHVHVEGIVLEWEGGDALSDLYAMTFQRLRDLVVGGGVLSAEEHSRLVNMMSADGFRAMSNTLFVARGQKPD